MTMLTELRKNADYGASANVIVLTNFEPDNSIIKKVVEDEPVYYCVKSDTKLEDLFEKISELTGSQKKEAPAAV